MLFVLCETIYFQFLLWRLSNDSLVIVDIDEQV